MESGTPSMRQIVRQDLTDDVRSLALFEDAVRRRLTGPGEASRLQFFALIERALRRGEDPPAMLFTLVKKGLNYANLAEEDAARGRFLRISGHVPATKPGTPESAGVLLQRVLKAMPALRAS